ncbi:MAG: tRNA preQ1(34) S-adenosylmethionine ribosyltransferase-isomerase QueA [bacterium]|nr:tRNA preQ1(34) S-adenosylmethionine ribosyltransferase-isomerase QueA [bacterium]
MKIESFDYKLSGNLIAQKPTVFRDRCKLMVLKKKEKEISHFYFYQIDKFLNKGDVVVLNDTKVFPARIFGHKETGGKAEILLLRPNKKTPQIEWTDKWWIIGRPNLKIGQRIFFSKSFSGEITNDFGLEKIIEFNQKGEKLKRLIFKMGKVPTPPYIKSNLSEKELIKYYQTIYAKNLGSVAGPTAGFHFTGKLIEKLKKKGVVFKHITLHIGLGTFQPINTKEIERFKISSEWGRIDRRTVDYLNEAKKSGSRIISVGTTTTRTLEGFCKNGKLSWGDKYIDLFIYPGYKFKFIDGLITNFHLPKSSTLLLTCAFGGKDFIFKAYKEAIKKKYRFYSFGDSMLII